MNEQYLAELKSMASKLDEVGKSLSRPMDLPHLNSGGGAVSYWAGTELHQAKSNPDGTLDQLPRNLPRDYRPCKHWKSAGEFFCDGFRMKQAGMDREWWAKHADAMEPITKAIGGMSTQVASDGAALILPEFNQTVMEKVYSNDLWSRTDQFTVVGNKLSFPANAETSRVDGSRHGGLRSYWVGEGDTIPSSKPTLRQFGLKLKKLAIVVYLTDELIEDGGSALEQYVSRKVSEEFNFQLGNAVFRGNGVGQPLGIFNSPPFLAITKETGQGAATIVSENIDKMWARRYAGSNNYAWFHNQDCGPQLDLLSQPIGTGGVALYRQMEGIARVAPQMLKDAPRVETEFNSTVGTVGDLVLADMGQYITISKGGIAQAVSVHVEFLTDQTALRFTMRVDGQPWEHSPVTPYQGSNTQSSFLGIETR